MFCVWGVNSVCLHKAFSLRVPRKGINSMLQQAGKVAMSWGKMQLDNAAQQYLINTDTFFLSFLGCDGRGVLPSVSVTCSDVSEKALCAGGKQPLEPLSCCLREEKAFGSSCPRWAALRVGREQADADEMLMLNCKVWAKSRQ